MRFSAKILGIVLIVNLLASCTEPPEDKDMEVGPCLSIAPMDMNEDISVGPCLSQPPPDMGPMDMSKDTEVGPCLSPPPEDMQEMGALERPALSPNKHAPGAQELLERFKGRLPGDVLAKLSKPKDA